MTTIYYVARQDYDEFNRSYTVNADDGVFYSSEESALEEADRQNDRDFIYWSKEQDDRALKWKKDQIEYDVLVKAGLRPYREFKHVVQPFKSKYFVMEAELYS